MSIFEKLKAEQEAKRKQEKPVENAEAKTEPSPFPQQVAPASPPTAPIAEKAVEDSKQTQSSPLISPSTASPPQSPMQAIKEKAQTVCEPKIPTKKWEGTEGTNAVKEEKGLGIMIYGGKGDGKTVLAFSVINLDQENKTTIACLSFDEQSQIIKDTVFGGNPRIQVFDALKYYSASDDANILQTSVDTFDYLIWLLTKGDIFQMKPDYVMIDGLEIFKERAEYKMRSAQHYLPFENFGNYGAWHQRTMFMDDIDIFCKRLAKIGIIYTSYINFQKVKSPTGEVTIVEPKWAGNTKTKTRIVIKVDSQTDANGRSFYATVESSKVASVLTSGRKKVGSIDNSGNLDLIGFKSLIAAGKTLI
jgi:hypothetical protein